MERITEKRLKYEAKLAKNAKKDSDDSFDEDKSSNADGPGAKSQ
jgi:hypothetical protein